MPDYKTPTELQQHAVTLAQSYEYVLYRGLLYAPVHCDTGADDILPPVEEKSWRVADRKYIEAKARTQFDILFKTPRQFDDFVYVVQQLSIHEPDEAGPYLQIRTKNGLKVLHPDGKLYDPDGTFIPNMLKPVLNEDPDDKAELLSIITEWVGGQEEEAMALIRQLATTLAPHWSSGKYVLLIGDGRNGKSVLMTMLKDLFGKHNCSGVERQVISEGSPGMFDLTGKLLNLVFDGPAEFVKDSGKEKSIISGEPVDVRKLYANEMTTVQTNALFVEGLNQEPKSRDKSSALQARLVRFWFPNKYAEDDQFFLRMRSERMLGALLALLLDNYVTQDDKAVMLAPTAASRLLQLEHMEANSLAVQFVVHLEETEALGAEALLVDMEFEDMYQKFCSWRIKLNDLSTWDKPQVQAMFRPVVVTTRKSIRKAGKPHPVKVPVITGLKPDIQDYLNVLKEEADATTVVDD
jgi:phage/plasmid-associated DNA primase